MRPIQQGRHFSNVASPAASATVEQKSARALFLFIVNSLYAVLIALAYIQVALYCVGVEPPLLKGVLLVGYILGGAVCSAYFLSKVRALSNVISFVLVALLIILFLAPVIAGLFFRPQYAESIPAYLALAFGNLVYAALGYITARFRISFRVTFGCWIAMGIFTYPALIEMLSLQFGAETVFSRVQMHITLGDYYMFSTLLLISQLDDQKRRLIVFSISIIILTAIGSRTSLFAFLAVLPVILYSQRTKMSAGVKILTFLVICVLAGSALSALLTADSLENTRMFSVFFQGEEDSAISSRKFIFTEGLNDIYDSPIFGKFRSDFDRFLADGNYIHNYLEMWRQFGIIPFGMFVYLTVKCGFAAVSGTFKGETVVSSTIAIFFFPYLFEVALSRSYGYPSIFFIFGMMAFQEQQRRWVPRARYSIGRG